MSSISANEWEVLSFFGVNPVTLDDTPWLYNSSQYHVIQDTLELFCKLEPASKEIEMVLKLDGKTIFQIQARQVFDIGYIEEANGKELLEVRINHSHSILIKIQPNICITESYEQTT